MKNRANAIAPSLTRNALDKRRAGVLLPLFSLPGGGLGSEALHFVDFIADSGFSVWQILPLGPTHDDGSPYHCLSAHAGNPAFISLERLAQWGWLLSLPPVDEAERRGYRRRCLEAARRVFEESAGGDERERFATFVAAEAHWLEDYALFQAIRWRRDDEPWWLWSPELRDRQPDALAQARAQLAGEIALMRFEQYVFARQWRELKDHARERGVMLFGDMPIFVAHDSAEVWARRECFKLDETGQPFVVAGVPPDYFSATGQRWGNPLYRWERTQADGFRWWITRLATEFQRFDLLRVDHFRGFEACWEIPAAERTAVHGHWVKVPGEALFEALKSHFGTLPLVAEDLGLITPEVHALRERFGFPGMRILQFAFDGGPDNPYLPHNHRTNSVVYTGTHDNDTTLGWFEGLPAEKQLHVVDYLGYPHEPMPWPLARAALASVAKLAVIPMQDLLMLGRGYRLNTPGTTSGNWRWQFQWEQLPPNLAERLRRMVRMYGRGA
ncbi:MAG: 4-alpha-glucanotransferase [Gammaproteobacteria bacterium]|nr:4-alpha-glucanotransferase [Gammaproteobacteria bacterium]